MEITATPPDTTHLNYGAFTWNCTTSGDTLVHFELQLDSEPSVTAGPADSSYTFFGLRPGTHQFRIRAVDTQSRCSLWDEYTWIVLYVLPRVLITTGPDSITSERDVSFFWMSIVGSWPVLNYQLQMDGGSFIGLPGNQICYSFTGLALGPHLFRICAYDQNNIASPWDSRSFTIVDSSPAEDDGRLLPAEFRLGNYPNPFNATTTIRYEVPRQGQVRLEIFNVRGERVDVPVDKPHEAGTYLVQWEADNDLRQETPSGIYICRLSSGSIVKRVRLILIK